MVLTCSPSYPLRRLRWEDCIAQEAGAAMSHDCAIVLLPGQQSKTLSQKKEKIKILLQYHNIAIPQETIVGRNQCGSEMRKRMHYEEKDYIDRNNICK